MARVLVNFHIGENVKYFNLDFKSIADVEK